MGLADVEQFVNERQRMQIAMQRRRDRAASRELERLGYAWSDDRGWLLPDGTEAAVALPRAGVTAPPGGVVVRVKLDPEPGEYLGV